VGWADSGAVVAAEIAVADVHALATAILSLMDGGKQRQTGQRGRAIVHRANESNGALSDRFLALMGPDPFGRRAPIILGAARTGTRRIITVRPR
jgi:hypothetical protein